MTSATLLHDDGAHIGRALELDADVVIVGSGPAGATVARELARAGVDVVVLEEGAWFPPPRFHADAFDAMAQLYRGIGANILRGQPAMPYLQGCAVGGTSVINGAISWRLPPEVFEAWVVADPGLGEAIAWESVEEALDAVVSDFDIRPTPAAIAGPKNLLLARGAEALGLAHKPIDRYVQDCRGLGRCLQGCPAGAKLSMDRTYLLDAAQAGARILARVRVGRIEVESGRAIGVVGRAAGGGRVRVRASRAVVLAASAVHTPALLLASGLGQGPVGRHFQCHPGASVSGWFDEPVRFWTGATQGHEVVGLRADGLKFEAVGFDLAIGAMRLAGVGRSLAEGLAELEHWAHWGVAVRAEAEGRVRSGWGEPRVRFSMSPADLLRMRRGVKVLCQLFFAAGARRVVPGLHGWKAELTSPADLDDFDETAPTDPRCYSAAVSHMFGTCRMGSDPADAVVGPDFRHHHVDRLYVADSSVFPTNLGVNPQTSIIALAKLCAARVAGQRELLEEAG